MAAPQTRWSGPRVLFLSLLALTAFQFPTVLESKRVPMANASDFHSLIYQLESVSVHHQSLSSLLAPLMKYNFSLPEVQLRRGMQHWGSNYRLRRVMADLITGRRQVKIGVVGGSITYGTPVERGVSDWWSIFSNFVLHAFPHTNISLRNGAVPGTPSSYMVMCLEMSIDPDVDIVFVEYQLNDGFEDSIATNSVVATYERLIRRILAFPRNPAVILVQTLSHGMGYQEQSKAGWRPFHVTLEDVETALAQYYDVQAVSLRTAAYRLASMKKKPGYGWKDVMAGDEFHPSYLGHKMFADLAVWMFQQTAIDLMMRPFSQPELEMLSEAMPEPMHPGNYEPKSSLCLYNDMLKNAAVSSEGWEYVNEGTEEKPKIGFVSWVPGSVLKLEVDTIRDGSSVRVPIVVAHLKSYTNMGKATVACVSGCKCDNKTVDAHHEIRESQTYLATVMASQVPKCTIAIVVEKEFSNPEGKTKFKVTGLMMPEIASHTFRFNDGEWGATLHLESERQHVVTREGDAGVKELGLNEDERQKKEEMARGGRGH